MYAPPQSSVIIFFNLKYLDQGKLCCYIDIKFLKYRGEKNLRWGVLGKLRILAFSFYKCFPFKELGKVQKES